MATDWAAENLRVTRTLMERGAVYRRTLAPITGWVGLTGIAAAVAAPHVGVKSASTFGGYWVAVAVICAVEVFFQARRQAMKDGEPLWSMPTRWVAQAVSPAFVAGAAGGLIGFASGSRDPMGAWMQMAAWMALYGSGIHAAGLYVPRGLRLFGWGFIVCGLAVAVRSLSIGGTPSVAAANNMMGAAFGGGHCAYSLYLYFTEKNRQAPGQQGKEPSEGN